jgi:hypothetical protein
VHGCVLEWVNGRRDERAKRVDNLTDHSVPDLKVGQVVYSEQMAHWWGRTPNDILVRLFDVTTDDSGGLSAPEVVVLYDSENKGRTWCGSLIGGEWVVNKG